MKRMTMSAIIFVLSTQIAAADCSIALTKRNAGEAIFSLSEASNMYIHNFDMTVPPWNEITFTIIGDCKGVDLGGDLKSR